MIPVKKKGQRDRNSRLGFTLLEVLGAVAVLGIWYFVLAAIATDGLLREGQSLRKLRAGLIADRILAELEEESLGGSKPTLIDEEVQPEEPGNGIYTIKKQVAAFTAYSAPSESTGEEQESGFDTSQPLPTLLGQNIPGFASHLYQIDVVVAWTEGFMAEETVHRTTYVFDMTSAAQVYESESMKKKDEDEDLEEEQEDDSEQEVFEEGKE